MALSKKSKEAKKSQNHNTKLSKNIKTSLPSKLCLTLLEKKNYVTSLQNITLLTELGMVVTKIHKVLKFVASPYLRGWITHNTKMRNKAKLAGNLYLDLFYKLVVNSTFGKMCENLRGKKYS